MNKYFLLLNILFFNTATQCMEQQDLTRSQQLLEVITQKPALYFQINVDDFIMNYNATEATKDDSILLAFCNALELNHPQKGELILRTKLSEALSTKPYEQQLIKQALDELRIRKDIKVRTLFHSRDQQSSGSKAAYLCATMYWMRSFIFPTTAPGIEVKITSVQDNTPLKEEISDQSYSRAIAFSNQYGLMVPNGY